MTKQRYLRELRRELRGVPAREREKLVDYYSEIIDDAYERGKTTREVFEGLDSPRGAAQNYLRESHVAAAFDATLPKSEGVKKGEGEPSGGRILARILVFFLAFPLSIAGVGVLLALIAAGLAVMVAGLGGVGVSFGLMGGHVALAFAQIGMGIGAVGVGLLLLIFSPLLLRLSIVLWRFVCGKDRREKKRRHFVRSLITGTCILLVGGIVFTACFGSLGFKREALAVTDNIVEVTQELEGEEVVLSADNLKIKTQLWEGSTAKLVYRDTKESPRTFKEKDGKYSLSTEGKFVFGWARQSWSRGILFHAVVRDFNEATLYLPQSYSGKLELTVANGGIELESLTLSDVSARVANGVISMKGVSAQSVYVQTTNGAIKLESVSATKMDLSTTNGAIRLNECTGEELTCSTSNGAVNFTNLNANDITFTTNVGAVSGTLIGKKEDYKVSSQVNVGHCNLTDRSEGTRSLNVKVTVGSIQITFVKP